MTLDRKKLDALDPVQANAIAIVQAVLDHQTPPGEVQQTFEPNLAAEACIVAAAAILETSRDEGMEREAKRLAQKLVDRAKAFRKARRQCGVTGLEQLGAERVTKITIQ